MQISITNIKTEPEVITITRREYNELKAKATRYDRRHAQLIENAHNQNNARTPEQRKAIAQKAAQARWNKKGGN